MVYVKTNLSEIPKTCKDCPLSTGFITVECSLPLKNGGLNFRKPYMTKRHEKCPLIEKMEEGNQ